MLSWARSPAIGRSARERVSRADRRIDRDAFMSVSLAPAACRRRGDSRLERSVVGHRAGRWLVGADELSKAFLGAEGDGLEVGAQRGVIGAAAGLDLVERPGAGLDQVLLAGRQLGAGAGQVGGELLPQVGG